MKVASQKLRKKKDDLFSGSVRLQQKPEQKQQQQQPRPWNIEKSRHSRRAEDEGCETVNQVER